MTKLITSMQRPNEEAIAAFLKNSSPDARYVHQIELVVPDKNDLELTVTSYLTYLCYDPMPPKPEYSKFFGYYRGYDGHIYVTGFPTFDGKVRALYDEEHDELLISSHRHDMVSSPHDPSLFIDGGMHYVRYGAGKNKSALVVQLDLTDMTFYDFMGDRHAVTS